MHGNLTLAGVWHVPLCESEGTADGDWDLHLLRPQSSQRSQRGPRG